jgi:hypothetical protein
MVAGFMIYTLPQLDWLRHNCSFEAVVTACLTSVHPTGGKTPEAWLGPPRKQLPAQEVRRRSAIVWDVPLAELEELFADEDGYLVSPRSYLAGTGLTLCIYLDRVDVNDPFSLGLYLDLTDYTVQGRKLASVPTVLSCECTMQRLVPGTPEPVEFSRFSVALKTDVGCGVTSVLTAFSVSDLEPHLVDGCLKLRAYIDKIA